MTAQFARPQQRGRTGIGQAHEPHAALLIDFDNVTMGIRSDLTKELKNLLNSDIIKGKVAVQRAYADWRRYPQYIVPLAESSVDLIFAPAYGSAKKNATDIRLAIDAIELVFTRPEIGTIILLSGDSDFSSMVLKLKEYGKYVIGVGIRESASDLLVQNCDEYYSYSALTGLTRAGDEAPAVSEDPWELVEMALRQMRENNDVMRSDRLKQVLLELDPSFDEKALGFQKFNKFLQEAASRGLLSLRKQDNGQFEIGPPDAAATAEAQADARGEARRGRGRRGRNRRDEGRREEGREPRRDGPIAGPALAAAPGPPLAAGAPAPVVPAERPKPQPDAAAATERPTERPKPELKPAKPAVDMAAAAPEVVRIAPEPAKPKVDIAAPRTAAGARAETFAEPLERPARPELRPERAAAAPEPSRQAAAPPPPPADAARPKEARPSAAGDLAASYDLLRRAASDLVKKSGQAARDSDVKRRMLELESGWDEAALGFSKFSRFLRQAHDAEVITLRKGDNGVYDVLPGNGEAAGRTDEPERDRERGRGRGRGRDRERGSVDGARPAVAAAPRDSAAAEGPGAFAAPKVQPGGAPSERAAASAPPLAAQPAARAPAAAPEPGPKKGPAAPEAPAARQVSAPPSPPTGQKGAPAPPAALMFRRGSRGRGAPSGPPPVLEGQRAGVRGAAQGVAAEKEPPLPGPASAPPAPAAAPPREAPAPESIAAALGLPQQPDEVASYIAANYKGVGPKSVQTLIEEFGAARVFDALEKLPDRVRELLGAGRGDRLLAAWQEDVTRRRASGTLAAPTSARSGARKAPQKRPAKAAKTTTRGAAAKTPPTAKSATAATAPAPLQTASPTAKQSGRSRAGRGAGRDRPPAK